jgi:hypothetical protein
MSPRERPAPRTFLLRLQAERNNDAAIHGLRWLLKALWHRYRVRVIEAREEAS